MTARAAAHVLLAAAVSVAVGVDVNTATPTPVPSSAAFAVVATTGRFDRVNPQVATQFAAASRLAGAPQLSLTPANPGPGGVFWGKGGRKACAGQVDTAGCAYDYGQRGVESLLATLRTTAPATVNHRHQWWIDVEGQRDVTWNPTQRTLNAEVLRGVRDALVASGVTSSVGIYTTSAIWREVVAGTPAEVRAAADLGALPVWAVGGRDGSVRQARNVCVVPSPTGGPIVMGQSIAPAGASTSTDVICPPRTLRPARMTAAGTAVVRGAAFPGSTVRLRVVQRGHVARAFTAKATRAGTWAVVVRHLAPRLKATATVRGGSTVFVPPAR
ncbi:hypothetical protein CLV35_3248 [Motilibacter peucedani]|uniref:Uncharacterized protein n=1 Tax=Motilibacter peucedani TaxID=598650 RepID=A0A420XME7_9ACTN|nr:hypothetical protein [Motilibacter peucedani]RKS71450.1 hypothetical protein CLV35_3248 [Motilibacter peucedani]